MNRQRPLRATSPNILQRLQEHGVRFRDLQEAPADAAALAKSFVDFPSKYPFSDRTSSLDTLRNGVYVLSCGMGAEMRHAINAAASPRPELIQDAAGLPEGYWMSKINFPTLMKAFDEAFETGTITVMQGILWAKGRQLQDARLTTPRRYANPRPDAVVGLDFVRGDAVVAGDPLCTTVLDRLRAGFPDFEPSPDGYALLPGFIFEAEPEDGRAEVLKAQVAFSAARALALLQHIRQLSGVESEAPMIPLATSAAHMWNFYLAVLSPTVDGEMDTTLYQIGPVLDITSFCDKVRLQLVLYRINHWLIQTHRQRVCEDLTGMLLQLSPPQRAPVGRARHVQAGAEAEGRVREGKNGDAAEGRAEPQVRPAKRGRTGRRRRAWRREVRVADVM
ncbi:hypothetical protein BCV69DRAFT_282048 [Microstroma glucosiphilum]|uniref:Uncharacterized protein n=1 Tax=Pseudomicrostroma glucosiphilum TaxID=1684307 RepID=A0A316U7U3_9BASI|nr:hypothetical protein BCV69DRAFT_282048 [Pseudomicrostroma glucosiphilum]PWN21310.1 hypothetical protein BCV69DRAFT_282048 [Pseudomicrostroma glucosiphilum]